jgi:hypothetical protein
LQSVFSSLCHASLSSQIGLGTLIGLFAVGFMRLGLRWALLGSLRLAGRNSDGSLRWRGYWLFGLGVLLLASTFLVIPLTLSVCPTGKHSETYRDSKQASE